MLKYKYWIKAIKIFNKSRGKMKKILEKSGKSKGILSEEKSGTLNVLPQQSVRFVVSETQCILFSKT